MINHNLKNKRILPNYNGGQPPDPRSLAHYRPKYEKKSKGRTLKYGPHTSVTLSALGFALQHSPILRKDKHKQHNKRCFASIF